MHYIVALTLSTFAICTSEFVIMGLLPEIADSLNVPVSKAGLLVTAYAMGVVIGGPILTVSTSRVKRKTILLGLLVIFIIGNVLCSLAPSYNTLMAARLFTSMCHGTFFGIASVVAADLSEPHNRAKAIAYVFMGATLANVLGVPLGTGIGQLFGWRTSFIAVALIGILSFTVLRKTLPSGIPLRSSSPLLEIKAMADKTVLIPLALSVLLNASLFTVFTYIAPILKDVTGVPSHAVTFVLLLFGVGLTIGSLLGGKFGDRRMINSIIVFFTATGFCLLALYIAMPYPGPAVAVMFVWSIATFAVSPMLQLLVVDRARQAPNLASTFNQSAYNLGNALGAWLGSVMLTHNMDMRELPLASLIIVAFAVICTVYLKKLMQKRTAP